MTRIRLLDRRNRQVQDAGGEVPGVVLGKGRTVSGGHGGRNQDRVLNVRLHGTSRLEGGYGSAGGLEREAEGAGDVVCAAGGSDVADQAAG